ncbi:hypothetical protein BKI52_35455 [marine bacterium AO1-C]|nr:hypothetical protein BKI52_35455 [marine bacterium AO1-C]
MKTQKFLIIVAFLSVLSVNAISVGWAQTGKNGTNKEKKTTTDEEEEPLEIINADSLKGKTVKGGDEFRILKYNVVIRHKGNTLYCDSAVQNITKNTVKALGNARMLGSDGTRVTSVTMFYDGNKKVANASGNVVLVDEKGTLTTESLDYDVVSQVAHYYTGAKIVDSENILTSKEGTYDTNSKIAFFTTNVHLTSKKDKQEIFSDNIQYNMVSKMAYFRGKTKILSKDGTVYANEGEYNTKTKVSNFRTKGDARPKAETEEYILLGDSLYYDNSNRIGFAKGNARLISKKDSIVIDGDIGRFWGKEGISKVYGSALMKNISEGDTLYLAADTLISIRRKKENSEDSVKILKAFHNTKIFRTELQGKCDSLIYNFSDSSIYMYNDPVLWDNKSQLSGDSIRVQMANNKIHTMHLRTNSFVIQEDTLGNYNQMKGRNMDAFFKENELKRVDVRGNGESIFFAVEGDSILTGMNRVICSDIDIKFGKKNKVKTVTFKAKPDGKFIPPHELAEPDKRLKGFLWRINDRPKKIDLLRQRDKKL